MAAIDELINKIEDPTLRKRIVEEVARMNKQKKFGLVFEEHLPEAVRLYDMPVKRGSKVELKTDKDHNTYSVLSVDDGVAECLKSGSNERFSYSVDELVSISVFGEPIYPYLQPIDTVCKAPDSGLWHTLIEADNYHALQLLEYLYAGKVDCIYIDPPYNTGARDWKYNNDYVDSNDSYRHSKWLSMMERRLKIAKKLLNPQNSVLIVTIDEKEYLHLGCLLEELFPGDSIQMVSAVISNKGNPRFHQFTRTNEFIFFVMRGEAGPQKMILPKEWLGNLKTIENRDEGFQWGRMLRCGNSGARENSPGCFYPIFMNKDGTFHSIGKPLPNGVDRKTVEIPENCIAVWPIHTDNTEGRWACQPSVFMKLYNKGFIKFGKITERGARITYIPQGASKRVESGEIKIIGHDKNGTVILDMEGVDSSFIPGTQWSISEHDATYFGSNLLTSIIGKQKFTFPKSLYAVRDTIRFFVKDKPDALILDFFAGSGTTLHAVNLLNEEDGGNRRCILVTNNEVSEEERKTLEEKGYQPGDEEWEKLGIARYVTWPRTVCSIEGHDVNGDPLKGNYIGSEKPMAEGFEANAAFFKLSFLDRDTVSIGRRFKELLPVLWMKAGAQGPCPNCKEEKPDMMILPENEMAILLNDRSYLGFVEELNKHSEIKSVFIVTDSESNYQEMIKGLEDRDTYQLYQDYIDHFRIHSARR